MAVPSSGELRLRADINLEVNGNATDTNVSLGALSNEVGFTEPDTMSEFYGYVSYVQPTISGTPSSSSVGETSMTITSPTFSNPSGGTIQRGFYFGTSTTMTNNTFYSVGNTSATSGTFSRSFTGLSGSTTYRAWAVLNDTVSPARFTQAVSSRKDQATLATLVYTTYQGSSTSDVNYEYECINQSESQGQYRFQYNHTYYGWTNAHSVTWNQTGPIDAWNSSNFNGRTYSVDRSGVSVQNRYNLYLRAQGYGHPNGSPATARITHYGFNTSWGTIEGRSWSGTISNPSTGGNYTTYNNSSTIPTSSATSVVTGNGTFQYVSSGTKTWST